MHLSEGLQDLQDEEHATDRGHRRLYCSVLAEHRQVTKAKAGGLYYSTLWASIVPTGNIYRYLGLGAEWAKHAEDLGHQLEAYAAQHPSLFEDTVEVEQRVALLHQALCRAQVWDSPDGPSNEEPGFKPLEEYLCRNVSRFGCFLYPSDDKLFKQWAHHRMIGLLVCAIQLVTPVVILLDEWADLASRLRDPTKLWRELNLREFMCLGPDMEAKLHTIMGVLLLELVILIVWSYSREQRSNSAKSALLPTDITWYVIGNITNWWCCLVTLLILPVRFWNEDTATSIAMDSLTLLFIVMLDDFAGYACTYLGKSDEAYQRATAWQKAMLSQCPLDLADVLDPAASCAQDAWSIRFDGDGQLLSARSPNQPCLRRLQRVKEVATESTALQRSSRSDLSNLSSLSEEVRLAYRSSRAEAHELPRQPAKLMQWAWAGMDVFSLTCQLAMPFLWMVVDKHCGAAGPGPVAPG